jgi:toxin CptA
LLVAAIAAMLVLALLADALSGLPVAAKLALGAIAIAYAGYSLRRFLQNPVHHAAWHAAGHWHVVDRHGGEHVADLAHATVRADWITLNLRRTDGARVTLVLAPDNSDADIRRRLRVRLARGAAEDASAV